MTAPPARPAGSPALTLVHQIAPRGERAEVVVTALVVAVIFAMLLPVPTWLLDLLIAINLCVSALLIVLVMQVRQTTGLSAFPSLFLVTTLFRVALSVASTRQILLNAEAGHIIEAFGEIVVGGNLVVGLVVFLVLTVVQFIVITKGSERVAEVGARFSLDAMPGRQMAIDMERKAGGITQEEAKAQRDALTEESQFFGAMDGTMKFAKGDSIVGIVIVLVNLLGGLSIGVVQRGMPAADALQVYAILTIGDGLVAQIPALLMSMTAGLLVTRVSKPTGGAAIGTELTSQLLHQPKAWVTASGAMLAFGLLPGMPLPAFAALAAGSAAVGLSTMHRKLKREREEAQNREFHIEATREFDVVRAFALRVSSRIDPVRAHRALSVCRHVRNGLVRRLALVTPPIDCDVDVDLPDADLEFCHGEVRVFSMSLDETLRTCTWTQGDVLDLGLPEERVELRGGRACAPRVWLPEAQALALSPVPQDLQDCWARLESLCEETLLRVGPMYFGMEETQKIAAWCGRKTPEVAKELERAVPVARMADVLRRLLTENVSIRNLPMIVNALIDWGPRERDPGVLTECVRAALQREICDAHAVRKELRALMFDSELEAQIRASVRQTAYGDFLALDAELTDAIMDETSAAYLNAADDAPVVMICAQDVRPHARKLLADRIPQLAVIGMSELPPDFRVSVRAVISVPLDGHPAPSSIDVMATEVALALELRVLTGLQSGAALPLEEPLLVGSGEEADLLLLDEGIAQAQSRLSLGADGDIRLEVLANDVVLQDGRRLASGDSLTLLPGQPFQIGPAWLMVQPDDAPWAPWTPPLPQARSSEPTVSGDMQAEERDEPSLPDETAAVKPGETVPSARRRRTGASGRKNAAPRRRLALPAGRVRVIGSLIVAAGLLSTMLGVAALVRQASGTERSDGAAATAPAESPASAPTPTPTPISDSASDAGSSPVPPPMSTPTASDDSPEPIGKGLVVQIPGEDDVVLPFDIAEVLMGLSSHVILSDGRRLHPGDRVGPWRLVAIQRGVLVFDGPRKVQVAW